MVAGTDIRAALGTDAPLALLSAAAVGLLYWLLSFLFFRRPAAETAVGAMASSYANANNIGIPVSLYAVGTAQHVAPVLLVQLLVMAPFYLTLLGLASGSGSRGGRCCSSRLSNPMIIASGARRRRCTDRLEAPDLLQKPIDMLAGGAVPMVLLAFGLSLAGRAPLQKDDGRTETLVATFLKIAGMPLIVWLLARFVFGLEGQHLLASVIMAAAAHRSERLPLRLPLRPGHDGGPRRDPLHHRPVRWDAGCGCLGCGVGAGALTASALRASHACPLPR